MQEWPRWWDYEVVFSPHLVERMQERGLTEVDLRTMLDDAEGHRPSIAPGRFLVATRRQRERWEIVVEPDELAQVLVVVTAYAVE